MVTYRATIRDLNEFVPNSLLKLSTNLRCVNVEFGSFAGKIFVKLFDTSFNDRRLRLYKTQFVFIDLCTFPGIHKQNIRYSTSRAAYFQRTQWRTIIYYLDIHGRSQIYNSLANRISFAGFNKK